MMKQQAPNIWNSYQNHARRFVEESGFFDKIARNDEWKYTSLKKIREHKVDLGDVENHEPQTMGTITDLVLYWDAQKWQISQKLKTGRHFQWLTLVRSEGFLQALKPFKILRRRLKVKRQDAIEALNASYNNEPAILKVKGHVQKPLVIYVPDSKKDMFPRLFIDLKSNSKLDVMFFVENADEVTAQNVLNSCLEVIVRANSELNITVLQAQNETTQQFFRKRFYLLENAKMNLTTVSLGAALVRNNFDVYMIGEGSDAKVFGLTATGAKEHVDHHTLMSHEVGSCNTHQYYKNILQDESRVVFNGNVYIHVDSQKANSEQLNKNLLLSRKAEVDSEPQLEIFADDVKATHGSTTGPINTEELFYLQSRAISKSDAQKMMTVGFVKEILQNISHPKLKEWADMHVEDKIGSMIKE